ncbi:hypothetical protein DL768_008516 [Monosporascus sp. mg162]|nr:hypothetical protein DL768_008516 [Monosporascus sp. mg162]
MSEPIAIVGSACRFPGSATSPSKLWDLLRAPRDVLREFPSERLKLSNFFSRNGEDHGRTNVENKSYLLQEDCRLFDAAFFRINPKEAEAMDPQQRLLLETVFEAIEAAGWPLEMIEGSLTSVHVGVMTTDFYDIQVRDPEMLPTYSATGLARSILSNRISYFFDFRGPSITIDTACSSSLVALHQAVQSLRNGEAAQAVVAGTALLLDPSMYIAESKLHMLSSDSRSRMWDKNANGYARGEGTAALILKPLSKAIEENDHIECIVRETGINSDGRTNGITMPSAAAQAALIRRTYERAGLDPVTDRCQYFECHGTGTPAGDPVEARAIKEALFPISGVPEDCGKGRAAHQPLYCGSVKTVIGHLEGCAGLAGVLKASLALQNKEIPPNMHFEQLNPDIAAYYDGLCVPTSVVPWPETNGKPLRASVNSFGFGGTNSHAILERYCPEAEKYDSGEVGGNEFTGLFVLSAKTRSSLLRTLKSTVEHITSNPSLDLGTLSWALRTRRTAFPVRTFVTALDREKLLERLQKQIHSAEVHDDAPLGIRAAALELGQKPRIVGVFTGQGAQSAAMGEELMTHCPLFLESLQRCESVLESLPERPNWSLMEELAAREPDSRVSKAEFSQPLCTAIQIALVDLLRACGINFAAVVGHSSGEIGAAYAAGILNAREAMGIAYYRGMVSGMARGPRDQKGGMMAVGMALDDAVAFCNQPEFRGRIQVAACNAPSSVTLSGDLPAICEAKERLVRDGVFARQLQVDTAYHSHHMLSCANVYLEHLKALSVQVREPHDGCSWTSSVYPDTNLDQRLDQLRDQYWVDNMVKPVLFSQALLSTMQSMPSPAIALEIGPHPALKGPVQQTLKATRDSPLPYSGCLERAASDRETIWAALGFVWAHLGPSAVDFDEWQKACSAKRQLQLPKNLPAYSWDHDHIYWHESRISHNYRLGSQRPHALLGRLQDDYKSEMTWRNVFRLSEMPWLQGHMFQGQALFPAAGYVSMALQAAESFAQSKMIKVVEIRDLRISRAIVVEDRAGVEVIFIVRRQSLQDDEDGEATLQLDFDSYTSPDGRVLDKACHGNLLIHFGQPSATGDLPPSPISSVELPPLDIERFFAAIAGLGIVYEDDFRALHSINRIWGHAKASASWTSDQLGQEHRLHPAVLDVGFQVGFATFASIAEGAMRTTYLPSRIRRVIVDYNHTFRGASGDTNIAIESYLANASNEMIEVDVNICDSSSHISGVQVEGLVLKAIAEPQPSDDRLLFAKTVWHSDAASGLAVVNSSEVTKGEVEYIDAVERTALFFMKSLAREIRPREIQDCKWHHQELFRAIETFLSPIREGKHAFLKQEWLEDDRETIRKFAERYPGSVDLELLTAVGENWPSVVRGESDMLEHMLKNDLLARLYMEGRGFAACNEYVAAYMKTITHKYPRVRILEVGAGTGGTTRSVLDSIGDAYLSYTYTDISAGFFEKAAEKFTDHVHKMDFKVLDAEKLPSEQGFVEGSYDIIIAANVLHATSKLSETMRRTRSLLRPGGFLVAVEVTGTMLREPGLMGGLEGWWLGTEDGRFPCPGISAKDWHDVLQANGFSGVDSIIYDFPDVSRHNCSVFVTQAVNDKFDLLREPLSSPQDIPEIPVVIIGGQTLPVSKAVRRAERLLRRWTQSVTIVSRVEDLNPLEIAPGTSVLCLTELDAPIFKEAMSSERLESLQEMLASAQNVLWVTCGRLADDPYSNMMVGVGRAVAFEIPHMQMQFLDFDKPSSVDIEKAVQHLARMVLLSSPEYKNHGMLWAQEPEIHVKGEETLIPRLVQDDSANESLNSTRRRIIRPVGKSEVIELVHNKSQPSLAQTNQKPVPEGFLEVDVELSIALHCGSEEPFYLCFGHTRTRGQPAFALSHTNRSTLVLAPGRVFEPRVPCSYNAQTLVSIASSLIASHILSDCPAEGLVLVYEPTQTIAKAISKAAERNVLFASATAGKSDEGWIAIHPLSPARAKDRQMPRDVSLVVDLSGSRRAFSNIASCLPNNCTVRNFRASGISQDRTTISAAYETAMCATADADPRVVNIQHADSQSIFGKERLSTVVDWKRVDVVNVIIPASDVREVFSGNKTYLLVGMAGELGQSLCRYMSSCGARHIVVASRNPTCDPSWLEDMRAAGVNIRVAKMDVTDRDQVGATITALRHSMPEIGGVANAALVLEDSLFVNTTADSVSRQLRPKVEGTIYLHEHFANDNLDFFVAFSSLGSVYGNGGQSIYHAANLFMTSLVEQRRKQGQAASVIDIGMISDVGYVAKSERSGSGIEDHLRSQFYAPLAETEFHHLFLQAVLSGHPGSENAHLTMGIQPFIDAPNSIKKPQWYDNPYFSHMTRQPSSTGGHERSGTSTQQLHERLENAQSIAEAIEVYQTLFTIRIESMMKINAASIDVHAPLSDLGLDSLLGVEIRTWLLREMDIDVPLLRILGRDSISQISSVAAKKRFGDQETAAKDGGAESQPAPVMNETQVEQIIAFKAKQELHIDGSEGSVISNPSSKVSVSASSTESDSGQAIDLLKESLPSPPSTVANTPWEAEGSVAPQDYERIERMSYSQASLYFLQSFLEDPTTFNVTAQYEIKGPLVVARFTRALDRTLARHDAFKTCFFAEAGSFGMKQGIVSSDLRARLIHLPFASTEDVSEVFQMLAKRHWKLSTGHTFQAVLMTHNPESHTIVFGCHHLVMDGLSWHLFLRDLDRAYQMLPFQPPKAPSYLDFSREQCEALDDARLEESIKYWIGKLDPLPNVLPLLSLAQTRVRKQRRAYGNNRAQKELSPSTVQAMKGSCKSCSVTLMQFYLTAFQTLLARLLDLEEICIGVTDTGRGQGEWAETIGHFSNLLPMRFQINKDSTFESLARKTSQTVLEGYGHAGVPLDAILEKLDMQRSSAYTPLFQVAFNYRIGDLLETKLGNCAVSLVQYEDARTPYDFTLNVTQSANGGHLLELISSDYLYSVPVTNWVLDTYVRLLSSLSLDQSTKVQDCKLYNDEQVESALSLGHGPTENYAWPETLSERFEEVSSLFPASIAIKDDTSSMTYDQLAQRVRFVTRALLDIGIQEEGRVAVLCVPSIDTYTAMLAILNIGAVYIPLDMSLPAARHHAMLEICDPQLLIFHHHTANAASGIAGVPTLNLSQLPRDPPSSIPIPVTRSATSFLLFTSGSTGTPKGIKLSQKGIMNYAASKGAMLGLDQIKVLQQSSTGFDMSIAQAFNAFANGGTLVIAPQWARGDPVAISQIMLDEQIEFTICTPSEYLTLAAYGADALRQCRSWRHACSGGEAVTDKLISELQRLELPGLILTDCYGPTEISCAATFRTVPLVAGDHDKLCTSVGKAIPNTCIYIVDGNRKLLPAGFEGEICIGGYGVAKGYLDASVSSAKFIRDPFATSEDKARGWTHMYMTGDKGCLREDGSLVFLGRIDGDSLVKLRGLRIELNEVANAILQTAEGSLADAVVSVRGPPQSEFLVAHVAPTGGRNLPESEMDALRSGLPLPRYMIPSIIIQLDRLPTTPNGKVDRKLVQSLPLPSSGIPADTDEESPLTVAEGELRLIWRDVLGPAAGSANIRAHTDFFTVGGSSLLLVRLQNALKEKMGVQMPLQNLYQASTLRNMAAVTSHERGQLLVETIDWAAETEIPAGLLDPIPDLPMPSSGPRLRRRRVLLTGSAGFLGSEILKCLITSDDVSHVYCVAISADQLHAIPESEKITKYAGSLLSPNLGLLSSDVQFLRSEVDQIIHAGAQGHCLNNYWSVRSANYLSTQFLVSKIALPRRVPLQYISSARVILFKPGSYASAPASMASHPPPTDGSQGFTASKWASERFLEQVSDRAGLPITIHRHCSIIGATAPHDDAMNSVIRYSLLSRTVPELPNAYGYFDFEDVGKVAASIAASAVDQSQGLQFRHHSSNVKVSFSQLAQRMEFLYGGEFKAVSMDDWLESASKLGVEDLIVSYLRANVAGGDHLSFPYLGQDAGET